MKSFDGSDCGLAGAVQLQMAKETVPWKHGPLTMPSAVKTSLQGIQVGTGSCSHPSVTARWLAC